ncbi:hypothetical protein EI427_23905 [Flammeovirga pectinis]|uniref:YtkA-like domain-containing protein n=1 Tax=Flammeovirga pectinis TaxID=2494373 RepID=A0A3Q9FRA4_9BACT|nr:FixH family protein [Flammeovirga pectinis]AZQ65262.1 hypothetical protein EI427_23905 [Flammeovirga pectinis]
MKNLSYIALFLLSFIFIGCNNDDNETVTPNNPSYDFEITNVKDETSGLTLKLMAAKENLSEGVNNVAFEVEGTSTLTTGGTWQIVPKMTMMMNGMTHKHSTPIRGFEDATESFSGKGQILFVMPTVEMGVWEIEVQYILEETPLATWTMPLTVAAVKFLTEDPAYKTVINLPIADSDNKIIMGYNFIENGNNPAVGSNNYEILAFKRIPSMGHGHLETYVPYTDLTFGVTPHMPSMDHGSPNNVDPVASTDGVYTGVVNFSMLGDWQLKLNVVDNDTVLLDEEGVSFYLEF